MNKTGAGDVSISNSPPNAGTDANSTPPEAHIRPAVIVFALVATVPTHVEPSTDTR